MPYTKIIKLILVATSLMAIGSVQAQEDQQENELKQDNRSDMLRKELSAEKIVPDEKKTGLRKEVSAEKIVPDEKKTGLRKEVQTELQEENEDKLFYFLTDVCLPLSIRES